MRLETELVNGVLVVRPEGELDLGSADLFRDHVDRALARGRVRGVVLNLSGVTFIDSSGLGAVLGRYRRVRQEGMAMAMAAAPAKLQPVLELSGLLKIMPLYSSEKEAVVKL